MVLISFQEEERILLVGCYRQSKKVIDIQKHGFIVKHSHIINLIRFVRKMKTAAERRLEKD
jgi:hypothetical protein